jgi:hypothetical protein
MRKVKKLKMSEKAMAAASTMEMPVAVSVARQAIRKGRQQVSVGCSGYGITLLAGHDEQTRQIYVDLQVGEERCRLTVDEARDVAQHLVELSEAALNLGERQ